MEKIETRFKMRTEQISFQSYDQYMDIHANVEYVDITIGGAEKFSVTLDEWKIINREVLKLLKQE